MEFEQLRDQLTLEGKTFDEVSLQELDFNDLSRAWIGDAGAAACTQELARAESQRRTEGQAWQILHQRMHPRGPIAMADPELFAAAQAFIERRPAVAPHWDSLSPISRAYLLLRCLRAHLDNPGPRFDQLRDQLQLISGTPGPDRTMAAYALLTWHLLGRYMTGTPDNPAKGLLKFRKNTFDFFCFVRNRIPAEDAEACSHLEVAGYHCSNGCFLPGAAE
jgi:hypothetical protein